jgi:hypothetical protein
VSFGLSPDICPGAFVGLNALRALSIIALLLLFASSILTLANDVRGVNRFAAADKSGANNSTSDDALVDCDYIEYVLSYYFYYHDPSLMLPFLVEQLCPTSRQAFSGR